MRLAKLDESLIGKKLGIPIKTIDGKKLVNANVEITNSLLKRLNSYEMNTVYIEDENVDITLNETLEEDKRAEVLVKLNNIYDKISKENFFNESELSKIIQIDIMPEINNDPVSIPIGKNTSGYDIAQHSLNVCLLSIVTGINLGLGMDKVEILAKASLLHDIGKIIDSKKYDTTHTQSGYDFLKMKTNSVFIYNVIRFHHETIDGEGPHKLKEKNQNELIKIISLCNFYESMISQKGLIPNACFENIQALVNIKFDQKIFDAFRESIYIYPTGLPVKLNNGQNGIVVRQNKKFPLRPFVKCIENEYNLIEHLSLFIDKILI